MDQVSEAAAKILYSIKEIMDDHHLTLEQAFYLLCRLNNVQYDVTATDLVALYNKGLLDKNKVNATKLFHLKTATQLSLDMPHESKPIGSEVSLLIAEKIEKEFVPDMYLTDEEKKYVAERYFKGDLTVARYFIIFRSLFPVKDKQRNVKWNKKFGFIYEGVSLWEANHRIAKKFHEIFRKKDIGAFLEATYVRVKDSTKLEEERCYMTKPFKFLQSYDDDYRAALKRMEERAKKNENDDKLDKSIDNLKV